MSHAFKSFDLVQRNDKPGLWNVIGIGEDKVRVQIGSDASTEEWVDAQHLTFIQSEVANGTENAFYPDGGTFGGSSN